MEARAHTMEMLEQASVSGTVCAERRQRGRWRWWWALALALALAVTAAAAVALRGPLGGRAPDHHRAAAAALDGEPFSRSTVEELARALSKKPYAAPPSVPEALAKLTYDQYRDLRVAPDAAFWADPGSRFRMQLLPPGYLFTAPVSVSLVEDGRAHRVPFRPELFTAGKLLPGPLPREDVGFSGLRLLSPINARDRFDEVAVFQGASYFRGVGRDQVYGLSARGLALKVASPEGEEFPAFRAFWAETPGSHTRTVVIYALLDSPSVTGAYRFEIVPGRDTVMRVDATLFPRVELKAMGIAPGTSMFMFGPNDRNGADDFRPQVHDSDGLLMVNGHGEHLWRPLHNPSKLQVSAFQDRAPHGFGLVQRDRAPTDYQDLESSFERRPSLWVEPIGDWGEGEVVLVEIPSDAEIHDNIVAYWHPKAPIPAGAEYHLAYRLAWGGEPAAARDAYQVLKTAVGRADPKAPTPVRLVVVDYAPSAGHPADGPHPTAAVTASAGRVGDIVVADNPLTGGYRVTFTLDPQGAETSELRAELRFGDDRRAEVWTYRWTKP